MKVQATYAHRYDRFGKPLSKNGQPKFDKYGDPIYKIVGAPAKQKEGKNYDCRTPWGKNQFKYVINNVFKYGRYSDKKQIL